MADFLASEGQGIEQYVDELRERNPFKDAEGRLFGRQAGAFGASSFLAKFAMPMRTSWRAALGAFPAQHLDPLAFFQILVVLEEVLDGLQARGFRSSGFCHCV